MDHILVREIQALGVHGVLPEERERPQPFEVDLDLEVDLAPAGASDALVDTVDYGSLIGAVEAVVTGERHQLLESLASQIADVCLKDHRVTRVTVTVRKLRPPVGAMVRDVGVRLER